MNQHSEISNIIFDQNRSFFERLSDVFEYQMQNQNIYNVFSNTLDVTTTPEHISDLPLLPIRAFKDVKLITKDSAPEKIFRSSGTGKRGRSSHFVADLDLYRTSIFLNFNHHFPKDEYSVLCYTPGYHKNPDSSLVWMLQEIIRRDESGFSQFLTIGKPLQREQVERIKEQNRKVLLFGAAFGLLDLIEFGLNLKPDSIEIIETGGMKTHRREMSKEDLRNRLAEGFNINKSAIHSEYGMCELLSQCYSIGSDEFEPPHWVNITIRKSEDQLMECEPEEEGKIGIIDLANIYSCPFILTEDRGVMKKNGRFKVLGRWNRNDLRGCNFLIDSEL